VKSISKLKKELDKWFSLYIRLRDSNDDGLCQCITCSKVSFYKSGMQCGHFQSRRFMTTRYDEQNCAVQCVACNMFRGGEQFRFALAIDAKHGAGTAEHLQEKAIQSIKFTRVDYEEKISYYKEAVKNFKKQKGIE
jgi:hypothetical protein